MVKRKIKLDRVRESSKESREVQKAGRPGGIQGRKVMTERHKSEGGKMESKRGEQKYLLKYLVRVREEEGKRESVWYKD